MLPLQRKHNDAEMCKTVVIVSRPLVDLILLGEANYDPSYTNVQIMYFSL